MGFSIGGIIFKNGASRTDEEIHSILNQGSFSYSKPVTMEYASSESLNALVIGRLDELAIVFARDLPHSASFEENELSKLDERLETASLKGDILCFLMNSASDTYAFSIFSQGRRVRGFSTAASMMISDFGQVTVYEGGRIKDDQGMIRLIEKFTGMGWIDLSFNNKASVMAYYH